MEVVSSHDGDTNMSDDDARPHSDAMQARLWEHRLSTNTDFTAFANFFLIAESILLATAAALIDKIDTAKMFMYVMNLLGLVLTVVWTYVQAKQKHLLSMLKTRCEAEFPEYRATRTARTKSLWKISNMWILTYVVPALFALAWISIFIWVITV